MEHEIHRALDLKRLCHILLPELEVRISAQVIDIPLDAGEQVIESDDPDILLQQKVAHMRPHKSRRSRNYGALFIQIRHNLECSTM